MADYPNNYKYSKEHEWIHADGSVGTIGITDYAQHSLGEIVFLELPKAGTEVKAGASFGTVESVKSVSTLFSPVSGTITEVNDSLVNSPEKINQDAHSAWMIKVQMKNPAELNELLSGDGYIQFLKDEDLLH